MNGHPRGSVAYQMVSNGLAHTCALSHVSTTPIIQSLYIYGFSFVRSKKKTMNFIREFSLSMDDHLIRKFLNRVSLLHLSIFLSFHNRNNIIHSSLAKKILSTHR